MNLFDLTGHLIKVFVAFLASVIVSLEAFLQSDAGKPYREGGSEDGNQEESARKRLIEWWDATTHRWTTRVFLLNANVAPKTRAAHVAPAVSTIGADPPREETRPCAEPTKAATVDEKGTDAESASAAMKKPNSFRAALEAKEMKLIGAHT